MNPITNSPIKEAMRQQYYAIAANKEAQITNQLNTDCMAVQNDAASRIQRIVHKLNPSGGVCLGLIIAAAIVGGGIAEMPGFIIGVIVGFGLCVAWFVRIAQINSDLDGNKRKIQMEADSKVQQLRNTATSQIRAAYDEADRRTQQDINQYDTEVRRNYQTILKKPDAFTAMVDHAVNMFQRMVSHADSASNRKFIETDFTYKVELYGICYKYQSTYSNPKDDFNFDKQRFRNLTTKEECEGLAQAIAKMTMSKMKSLYPPNSLNITVSHIDAEVTLHFRAANKNYVPPRDIY